MTVRSDLIAQRALNHERVTILTGALANIENDLAAELDAKYLSPANLARLARAKNHALTRLDTAVNELKWIAERLADLDCPPASEEDRRANVT